MRRARQGAEQGMAGLRQLGQLPAGWPSMLYKLQARALAQALALASTLKASPFYDGKTVINVSGVALSCLPLSASSATRVCVCVCLLLPDCHLFV